MKSKNRGSAVAVSSFAVASLLGIAQAFAQTQGPDVIVGELPDVQNYGTGTVGGVTYRAYAVGTTSCNLGNQILTWIANNNTHPVISQNMYRLREGRFEQIAQAWLKHGFCSLQGTVCGVCTPGGDCNGLFPGCSDPYGAGLNGSQSGLGPKCEVNAATGAFPYPWVNQGTSDNATLFKRLRVDVADINNANSLYFLSSMYVQSEDAAAGNKHNNESYRRITFTGANNDLSLQGTTQRTKAGIYAWRDHGLGVNTPDPSVVISPVDVPGDGRFIIGSKAINIGGGMYRYEYAVQNLNSDRSGASFTIPIPAGALVTNIGFHDVPYHSGEPYNSTDWTASIMPSGVTWTCVESFAQNVNANALRWDTIYSFWFESNIPPSGGAAFIGLFKPGAVTSVSGASYVPSPDGQFHPLNDTCAAATVVGNGTTNFSNTNATTDGPAEPNFCNANGYTQIGNDVWFSWTNGPNAGDAVISLCGSTFDTKLAVYAGATCPSAAGNIISCSDNARTCSSGNGTQSEVAFRATANGQYLIRVGGYNGATGDGVMNITAPLPPVTGGPANDLCANAQYVADGVSISSTTVGAHGEGASTTCATTTNAPDLWYVYRPQTAGVIRLDTCGSTLNTVVSVYSGQCGGSLVACNDNALSGPCSGSSTASFAAWVGTAGIPYYIRVAGLSGQMNAFQMIVTGGGGTIPATAPANDTCINRTPIGLGESNFTTIASTTDGPTHAGCNLGGDSHLIANDVWYSFNAPASGTLTIRSTGDATFSPKVAVYDGFGCSNYDARLLSCGNACTAGTYNQVDTAVLGGQSYTIRLGGGSATARGTGKIVVALAGGCVADVDNGNGHGVPDGGVTLDDLLYYLDLYGAGSNAADVDDGNAAGAHDCGVGLEDLLYYLGRYDLGC